MKIAFIGQPEYFQFMFETDLDSLYTVLQQPMNFSGDLNQFEPLQSFDADVNFFFRGEFVPDTVLERLSGIKVNLSSEPFPGFVDDELHFTSDSVGRFKHFLGIADKPFDYIFHYDEASKLFLEKQGVFLSGYFAFPVATHIYRPDSGDKQWDIFFIGRSTPHRESFFGPLKHYFKFLHIAHGVWGLDLVPYINASKLVLNVHAENEISWEPRLQMFLACGALVVSEQISSNRYLVPGRHYIQARGADAFFKACERALADCEATRPIRDAGMETVRETLAATNVFPEFIEKIRDGEFKRPVFDLKRLRIDVLEICSTYPGFDHLLDGF